MLWENFYITNHWLSFIKFWNILISFPRKLEIWWAILLYNSQGKLTGNICFLYAKALETALEAPSRVQVHTSSTCVCHSVSGGLPEIVNSLATSLLTQCSQNSPSEMAESKTETIRTAEADSTGTFFTS